MNCPHASEWGKPPCNICYKDQGVLMERNKVIAHLKHLAAVCVDPQGADTYAELAREFSEGEHWQ